MRKVDKKEALRLYREWAEGKGFVFGLTEWHLMIVELFMEKVLAPRGIRLYGVGKKKELDN